MFEKITGFALHLSASKPGELPSSEGLSKVSDAAGPLTEGVQKVGIAGVPPPREGVLKKGAADAPPSNEGVLKAGVI